MRVQHKIVCIHSVFVLTISLALPDYPARSQEQQPVATLSPNELLETAVKRADMGRTGFRFFGRDLPGLPGLGFTPIQGLDNPQAVVFLMNVLDNGPAWTDEKLLKASGGMYPHIARCYSALCLGVIGDQRTYEPLVKMLRQGTYLENKFEITYSRKERYHISDYAAYALGYLGDPNAVDPLIAALRRDKREGALFGLTRLRDLRAIKPIIDYGSDKDSFDATTHHCLQYITGARFRVKSYSKERKHTIFEFPELGKLDFHVTYTVLWQHWWKEKDRFAKRQFEQFYPQWKSLRKNRPNDKGSQFYAKRNMLRGGVPTLPFLMNAIEKGDESLVPTVSEFTHLRGRRFGTKGLQIKPKATRTECLNWWKKNENKWKVSDHPLQ